MNARKFIVIAIVGSTIATMHAQSFFACRVNGEDGASTFWSIPELDLIQVKLENRKLDLNETLLPVVCVEKPESKKRKPSFLIDLCKKKDSSFERTMYISTDTTSLFYCENNKKQPIVMPTPLKEPAQKKCQWLYGTATISKPYELSPKQADCYAENLVKKITRDSTSAKELYDSTAKRPSSADKEKSRLEDPIIAYLSQLISSARTKEKSEAQNQKILAWEEALVNRVHQLETADHKKSPAATSSSSVAPSDTTSSGTTAEGYYLDRLNSDLGKIYDDKIWLKEVSGQMEKPLNHAGMHIFG